MCVAGGSRPTLTEIPAAVRRHLPMAIALDEFVEAAGHSLSFHSSTKSGNMGFGPGSRQSP